MNDDGAVSDAPLLGLACKACGTRFQSGVPLRREHVEGVRFRALEVCPVCGSGADYLGDEYLDPDAAPPGAGETGAAPVPPQPGA